MNAAYISTIGKLRREVTPPQLPAVLEKIRSGFALVYGQEPSEDEVAVWARSIPRFIGQLTTDCDSLPVLIELRMPIGNERADIVLLGGKEEKKALVVELKSWTGRVDAYPPSPNCVRLGGAGGILRPHPAYQADGYVGKLRNYHSVGQDHHIQGLVYLHEVDSSEPIRQLMSGYGSRVFFRGDGAALGDFVTAHLLPSSRNDDDASRFGEGEYTVSARLIKFVHDNKDAIKQRIYKALAATGFSLCEEQMLAVAPIIEAALEAKKARETNSQPPRKTFMLNGAPGSGKTLVALTLLIECLGQGIKAVYVLRRNGAMIETLHALGDPLRGSVHYANVPRWRNGILDPPREIRGFDLIICDEAQRLLRANLPEAHKKFPSVVLIVDETQALTVDEEGDERNFREAAQAAGSEIKVLPNLPPGIRCRGGVAYHNFVEKLLNDPFEIPRGFLANSPWGEKYRFQVFETYAEFRQALIELRDARKMNVALVASWTESGGVGAWRLHNRPTTDPQNVRIGPRLPSGNSLYPLGTAEVSWVMNRADYREFWDGASNGIDSCASVYGAQGFEADAVGFVWGRDLVLEDSRREWALGGRRTNLEAAGRIYDETGRVRNDLQIRSLMNDIDKNTNHPRYQQVKKLLVNRARIFLTRGIFATLVYAEDPTTRSFLRTL